MAFCTVAVESPEIRVLPALEPPEQTGLVMAVMEQIIDTWIITPVEKAEPAVSTSHGVLP